MLGETFEILTDDFKFVSEQVSHHPPISASCGYNSDYEVYTHTEVKGKFTGKSLRFIPLGSTYVKLKATKEKFSVTRPVATINNLIFGKMYFDLDGTVKAVNHDTGEECEITCHKRGSKNKNIFLVDGVVRDKDGKDVYDFYGHWNDQLKLIHKETKKETLLWKRNPRVEGDEDLYYYSLFALNLNYLDDHLATILPPTDSRFRED